MIYVPVLVDSYWGLLGLALGYTAAIAIFLVPAMIGRWRNRRWECKYGAAAQKMHVERLARLYEITNAAIRREVHDD